MRRVISLRCLPEMSRRRGTVALVICPIFWSLRELATSGRETSTRGIPQLAAVFVSKKLSSAPDVFWLPSGHSSVTRRQVLFLVEDSILSTSTSAPRSTSGRALFPDSSRRSVQSPHSRGTIESSPSPSPLWSVEPEPPSWLPALPRKHNLELVGLVTVWVGGRAAVIRR